MHLTIFKFPQWIHVHISSSSSGHQVLLASWHLPPSSFFFLPFFFFLWPHLWHVDGPRLGAKTELQLQAYATATTRWDQSHIWNLHCSLQQCQILNPLSEARDQTESSWILVRFLTCLATLETPITKSFPTHPAILPESLLFTYCFQAGAGRDHSKFLPLPFLFQKIF